MSSRLQFKYRQCVYCTCLLFLVTLHRRYSTYYKHIYALYIALRHTTYRTNRYSASGKCPMLFLEDEGVRFSRCTGLSSRDTRVQSRSIRRQAELHGRWVVSRGLVMCVHKPTLTRLSRSSSISLSPSLTMSFPLFVPLLLASSPREPRDVNVEQLGFCRVLYNCPLSSILDRDIGAERSYKGESTLFRY